MPDWYVRRNGTDNPYPYAIRLGGCEYSLTEEEWNEFTSAIYNVDLGALQEVESEDYKDIVIASGDAKKSLSSIMGQTPREPMKRRI